MNNTKVIQNLIQLGLAEIANDGAWTWTHDGKQLPSSIRLSLSNLANNEIEPNKYQLLSYEKRELEKYGFDPETGLSLT